MSEEGEGGLGSGELASLSRFLDIPTIERELLSKSLHEYVKAAWHLVEPATALSDRWYLRVICDHLQAVTEGKIQKLIINIPPRMGKSNIVTVLWPTWEWTRQPELRGLFATYDLQKLSMRDSVKRRDIVGSRWYQERWGHIVQLKKDQQEKSQFSNTATGQMICTSTGANVTGLGGERLVLDDPQDPEGAESEVKRGSTETWLTLTWPSRRNTPNTPEVLVQQRLHERDATGLYMEQGGWHHLCLPMEREEKNRGCLAEGCQICPEGDRRQIGESLDPTRFPPKYIKEQKVRLGPYGYAGQYQQRPAPLEGGVFKRSWMNHYDLTYDNRVSVKEGLYQFDPKAHIIFATADLAAREEEIGGPKKGSKADPDYTVIAAWSVFHDSENLPILCLLDLLRERMEGPDILKKLKAFHKKWNFQLIGMETIAFQLSMFQFAKREGLPVREISTRNSDDVIYRIDRDKMGRAMRATPLMADGRFWIPRYEPWLERYLTEMCTFPNSAHDDMVDVTAFAVAIAEKIRTSRTFSEPTGKRRESETLPSDNAINNPHRDMVEPSVWDGVELDKPVGWD